MMICVALLRAEDGIFWGEGMYEWMRFRRWVWFLIISLILCLSIAGCRDLSFSAGPIYIETHRALASALEENQPENLELRFAPCQEPGPARGTRIERITWTEDGDFLCVVTIDANCSDDFWAGDYTIENENELILKYTTLRSGGEDACLCQVELRYRLSNLERRDYSITVQQADLVTP